MRFSEAFRETLFRFDIKGADLAAKAGLTPTQISKFRNGENLRIDSVERILEALPLEAREYMLLLVLQQREADHLPLPVTVRQRLTAEAKYPPQLSEEEG
ncbi:helix-turn-helix domain-containing protein [Leptolyngbya sp. NK1-12]|uniref:Helix-turn-helix domain-containing protein n=1 Tax=Leptolyngbya sp. NK1-12 TaxID=2547451 RepID=A0AA96WD22_9CYAN|nr:helix-turn-helix transcriptional regulator [Leptolyngbya sp. NK1-12]WNZ22720.1 helix-turn-helix domain-containing protein [Leptolyngbya sp. NK1-12]